MREIDMINELPEPDKLPPANKDSAEYRAGFEADKEASRVGRRAGIGTHLHS